MTAAITLGQLAAMALTPLLGLSTALALQAALLPMGNVYVGGLAVGSVAAWYGVAQATRGARVPMRIPRAFAWFWVGWAVLAALSATMNGANARQVTQLVEFLFYGAVATAVYNIARDPRARERLLTGVTWSAWPLGLLLMLSAGGEVETVAFGRNETSFYLVLAGVATPLASLRRTGSRRRDATATATVAVAFGGILAAGSRGALWVGAACVAVALLPRLVRAAGMGRRASAAILVAGMAGMAGLVAAVPVARLVPTDFSTLERISLLRQSWDLLVASPWVGHGWGSLETLLRLSSYTELTYPHPHNTYARFAAELGVAGALLPVLLYAALLLHGRRLGHAGVAEGAGLCAYLALALAALSMVESTFYGASRAVISVLLIAAALSYRSESEGA